MATAGTRAEEVVTVRREQSPRGHREQLSEWGTFTQFFHKCLPQKDHLGKIQRSGFVRENSHRGQRESY